MKQRARWPRVSWPVRAGLFVLTLAVGLGVWRLPAALQLGPWTEDAVAARNAIAGTNDEIEAVGSTLAAVEQSLDRRDRANEGLTKRVAKQRTTIAELEERVRELGGDPDAP